MAEVSRAETQNAGEMAQRFVQLIMVQVQNILFVLGKIPTPDGNMMPPNLQAGKMLIDQLEVIKIKTQGNLSAQEARILDDALQNAQLAFVEASGGTPASMIPSHSPGIDMNDLESQLHEELDRQPPEPEPEPAPAPRATAPAHQTAPPKDAPAPKPADDPKKKFFKSYG